MTAHPAHTQAAAANTALLPRTLEVFIDLETEPGHEPPPPSTPGYPEPLPGFEQWLDGREAPAVPTPEQLNPPRNYKDEVKILAWRKQKIEDLIAQSATWHESQRTAYDKEVAEHATKVGKLWSDSALDPFLGGRIQCIGIAVGDGEVKVLDGSNVSGDELFPQERENRILLQLAKGLRHYARQCRQLRIVAWNGFGFDFRYLALASARASVAAERAGQDTTEFDVLTSRFWHGVAYKAAPHLVDPRESWYFGDRWRTGQLPQLARFFGFDVPDWYAGIDHAGMELEVSRKVVVVDVQMLRHVYQRFNALGVGV